MTNPYGLQFWIPEIPPGSPHSDNDEFDDSAISGSWTTWDHGSIATYAEGADGLSITASGNGSARWCGKYKAIPASEFAVIVKVGIHCESGGSGAACGIVVGDTLSTTSSDLRSIEIAAALNSTSTAINSRTWSAWNGSASASTSSSGILTGIYLRVRCNGTAMQTDYSNNGQFWKRHSSVTLGFTPVHVGLGLLPVDNGVVATAKFRFYRVWSGANSSLFDNSTIGDYAELSWT